jgi:hypothetical protein
VSALLPGLAAYLAQLGHGTYSTTTPYEPDTVGIVLGMLPAAPDRCIAVTAYAGAEANTNEPYDQPNVQFRVRGDTDERTSRELAQAIYDDLHGLGVVDLPNGLRLFNAVGLQSGPIYIGTDANNRHENTVNLRVEHLNETALRPDL